MLDRRRFLQSAAVASAIGLSGLEGLARIDSAGAEELLRVPDEPLPSPALLDTDPDRYWAQLRRQWLLAVDHINLNCGSVGCSPLPVLRALVQHILSAEEYREAAYPWFGYEENTRLHELRDALAAFIGCTRDELALVRNATEANNIVANGLDFAAGDEVLLTDQEHPGGRCAFEQRVKRHGIKINYVQLPKPPASVDELVGRFEAAMTPRTKLVFFSHITTVTGVILPAKEICGVAHSHGALVHVDGAHAIGQIPLDLHGLGCDFYGSSPHKWLMAPKGTGFLYIRDDRLKDLWVNIATANWDNYDLKAYRFSWLGTSNLSVMVGLKAAIEFHRQIGSDRIYAQMHQLATGVRDHVAKFPQVRIANASSDPFFGGMVSFEPMDDKTKAAFQRVADECGKRGIRVAGGAERMRISTHIFTQPTELQAFYDVLDSTLQS